ncbi:hypothetical protein CC86DRAFT_388524 [Ophiobolus disseminans]|uniref:Uncharacterized protein n=1 Tax=Ophiobolus disseminans TaxID=1469910 RepID=A0A6A6ZET0_9PLEO|nr:hypothetical protein CC86DRAFT_388524 [Ophiobolus disseminans]
MKKKLLMHPASFVHRRLNRSLLIRTDCSSIPHASFLQDDVFCQQNSELHPLLGRIFGYSNQCVEPSTRPSEIAAGFLYFLYNGKLAYEWVYFFDIAPDRLSHVVPPEVIEAYEAERHPLTEGMMAWEGNIQDGSALQEPERIARQLLDNLVSVGLEEPAAEDIEALDRANNVVAPRSVDFSILYFTAPTSSLEKSTQYQPGFLSNNTAWSMANLTTPPQPSSSGQFGNSSDDEVAPIATSSQDIDLIGASPIFTINARQFIDLTRSAATSAPAPLPSQIPVVAPANVTLVPVPVVPTQQQVAAPTAAPAQLQPAAQAQQQGAPRPPRFPPAKQARFLAGPRRPAGSVTHLGRGNVGKAWSRERVRAFTDIQGYSSQELPSVAMSEYGNELSRDCTPASVDPRLCPFDTTLEENFTVNTST